ncbi:MAG TPA: tetratricopeptide repeat protein [Anaerolineales bacterium]|nr:tetratricopeptide repeat protein [Anaerolineales bacterium]
MDEAPYSFGEWVRRRRKALDFTQQELADRAGCSLPALQKIEREERRPSRQLAALLADQLQISPEQREKFIRVARGERTADTLPSTLEPVSPPQAIASAAISYPPLPVPATPLIGRENELETIRRLLADPACRLVTLAGPGGIGKTRLALEIAHLLQNEFADGVYFAQLVGVKGTEFIVPSLAEAVGFTFSGAKSPNVQLQNFLRGKRMLIVTDNFEHLLAGADLLNELLQHAPELRFLVTSREPLHLQAEWTLEVQGLPVPEESSDTNSSAAQLFLLRARHVRVGFQSSDEDAKAIANICRLVGGVPLGIELAAAWVRVMSLNEILNEIQQNLHFLTSTARDIPERHRSLRTVFDYSWRLLTEEEQTTLARLSVFRGGFTREASQKVTGASLPTLLALIDKSLVRRAENDRFDLHELVRQYAAEHLADPESVQAAHAETYLNLWRDNDALWSTAVHFGRRRLLSADLDNFRVAWDWAVAHEKFEWQSNVFRAIWGFHEIHGSYAELRSQMESAAQMARGKDPRVYGRALTYQAWANLRYGQIADAQATLDEALTVLRPLEDPTILFEPIFFKGILYFISGDWAATQHWLAEARAQAVASGVPRFIAQSTVHQSGVLAMMHNDEESFDRLQAALERLKELDLMRAYLTAFNTYTVPVALRLGRLPELYQPLKEALDTYQQIGDPWMVAVIHSNLGTVLAAMGEMDEARSHAAQSLLLFKQLGSQADIAFTHLRYGRIELVAKDFSEAEYHFRESIRIGQSAQAFMAVADSAAELAKLWAADEKTTTQAMLLCTYLIKQPTTRADLRAAAEALRVQLEAKLSPSNIEAIQTKLNAIPAESLLRELVG